MGASVMRRRDRRARSHRRDGRHAARPSRAIRHSPSRRRSRRPRRPAGRPPRPLSSHQMSAHRSAVLLDIEGTMCPIAFVQQQLFPWARAHLADYLVRHWDTAECQADVAALHALVRCSCQPPSVTWNATAAAVAGPLVGCTRRLLLMLLFWSSFAPSPFAVPAAVAVGRNRRALSFTVAIYAGKAPKSVLDGS